MKRSFRLTLSGLIAALMLISGLTPSMAHAADASEPKESITLSPVNKRYKIDAGSTTTDEMTIVNDGGTAYDFILYARPYSIKNNAYDTPDFTSTPSNGDVYRWIQFNQTKYHIEAGQTIKVGYTLRVPKDTPPGGHYGVLFAETQPSEAQSGSSVARKKRVGMIIYATVNGQYRMAGKSLGSTIPFLQFHAPLTAKTTVQNDGNSDFVVSSIYTVSDIFGHQKYQVAKDFAVLPQTKRELTLAWENAPWFGLYHVQVDTSFLTTKHTDSGYVLLMPRWLLIVIVITVVGGVLYVVLRRKH